MAGWPAEAHFVRVVVPPENRVGTAERLRARFEPGQGRRVCMGVVADGRRSMWWMAWHGGSDCAGRWARSLSFPRGAVCGRRVNGGAAKTQWWDGTVAS